jgi:hypothetical protein
MNPWRVYFLLLQDLAWWRSTHGGMISSNLHGDERPHMDVVTLSRGKKTSVICIRNKEGCFSLLHWVEITTKYCDGLKFRRNVFSFFGLNLLVFFFRGPTVCRSSDQHSTFVILATNIPRWSF